METTTEQRDDFLNQEFHGVWDVVQREEEPAPASWFPPNAGPRTEAGSPCGCGFEHSDPIMPQHIQVIDDGSDGNPVGPGRALSDTTRVRLLSASSARRSPGTPSPSDHNSFIFASCARSWTTVKEVEFALGN